MVNQKKEWSIPQIITLNNSSIQDGTGIGFGENYVVCAAGATCIDPATANITTTYSTGQNQFVCTAGSTALVACAS